MRFFLSLTSLALAGLLAGCPSPFQAAVPDQVPAQAMTRIAGSHSLPMFGKPELTLVYDFDLDAKGSLYLIDMFVIRKLTMGQPLAAVLEQDFEVSAQPRVLAVGQDGTIYAADMDKHSVFRFKPGEAPEAIAKADENSHDLDSPDRLRVDGNGRVYVMDSGQVFEISPTGFMSTLFGKTQDGSGRIGGVDVPAGTEMVGLEVLKDNSVAVVDGKGKVYVRDAEGKGRSFQLEVPKSTTAEPPELGPLGLTYRLDHKEKWVAFRDRYESTEGFRVGQFFSEMKVGTTYNFLGQDVYRYNDEGKVTKHHFIPLPSPGHGAAFDTKGALYLGTNQEIHRIQL